MATDENRTCRYCGDPVHPYCWFSVAKRHCFERAMGEDCVRVKDKAAINRRIQKLMQGLPKD